MSDVLSDKHLEILMIEALVYYENGIEHFYDKIDFGASFLDAKAIEFMNISNSKIKYILTQLKKSGKIDYNKSKEE